MFPQVLGQQDGILSTIIWIVLIILLSVFMPRMMVSQTIWKLEKDLLDLHMLSDKSTRIVFKRFIKKPSKAVHDKIRSFLDFFIAEPVSVDPYGIVRKIDHVVRNADMRQKEFVNQLAPYLSETEKEDFRAALIHTSGVYQIEKVVRHYLETIKKYKIFQLALILQMQIPMIKKIAEALYYSVDAFSKSIPIGDGIGPLVIASFMENPRKVKTMKEEEFVYYKANVSGRNVIFSKALGPGTSIGKPGKFVDKMVRKERITRIITVDAAMGLEGERTGSIAEGVGFGMRGGNPVDSFEIEEIAVKRNIYLEDIAIKEISEEAILPMKKQILDSFSRTRESVKSSIERAPKREKILVIGLGNTCGIGNDRKGAEKISEKLRSIYKKQKPEKKSGWF